MPVTGFAKGRGENTQRHLMGRIPYEDQGRYWSDALLARQYRRSSGLKRQDRFFPGAFRYSTALPTHWCQTYRLQNCEKYISIF
jgi:hypothetical protein